jgi:hypothetical protein
LPLTLFIKVSIEGPEDESEDDFNEQLSEDDLKE